MMRSFKHPNVENVIGACLDPLCLVSEYEDLGSLFDIIRISPNKLSWNRVKVIALEAARGMAFLHGQKPILLHKNLTSSNVLINQHWSAKISSPGFLSLLSQSPDFKLAPNKRWTAPEVLSSSSDFTKKSDVYVLFSPFRFRVHLFNLLFPSPQAFGMVLYHMIFRRIPFHDFDPNSNSATKLTDFIISVHFPSLFFLI